MPGYLSKWFREAIPDVNQLTWLHIFSEELNVAVCIYFIVKFTEKKCQEDEKVQWQNCWSILSKVWSFHVPCCGSTFDGFFCGPALLCELCYTVWYGGFSMQFDRSYIFLLSGRSLQIHACLSDYERCERIFTITFIHAYLYC